MEEWYVQSTPVFNSGFEYDEFNNYTADGLNEILEETPLGSDIVLCKGNYNNTTNKFETELVTKGIVQGVSPDTQTKSWQRQLITRLNTISDYKYVKSDGSLWLITTKPANNKLYEKVVLYLCNYIARWQDVEGNIICEPFVVTNASQYNSGVEGNKTVMIGYNQLLIYTSLNCNTVVLNREKRMFIDYNTTSPIPYKITRLDTVSNSFGESRIMTFVMTEDQYNPATDRIDLMLCDYVTQSPTPTPSPIFITYNGQAQVRSGGSAKTFTAVSDNEITLWTKVCTTEQEDYIVLVPDANDSKKCKVKCLSNDLLIGSSFRLQCTDGTSTGNILITIAGGM